MHVAVESRLAYHTAPKVEEIARSITQSSKDLPIILGVVATVQNIEIRVASTLLGLKLNFVVS